MDQFLVRSTPILRTFAALAQGWLTGPPARWPGRLGQALVQYRPDSSATTVGHEEALGYLRGTTLIALDLGADFFTYTNVSLPL